MQIAPILQGWLVSSALLIAEHVGLWQQPWRLDAPWNYIVGLGTVLFGCFVWAVTVQGPVTGVDAWGSFFLIATSGGWVALGYYIRGRLAKQKKHDEKAVKAIRLTQELIDQGGPDGATRATGSDYRRN